jgi:hypothetical protein
MPIRSREGALLGKNKSKQRLAYSTVEATSAMLMVLSLTRGNGYLLVLSGVLFAVSLAMRLHTN